MKMKRAVLAVFATHGIRNVAHGTTTVLEHGVLPREVGICSTYDACDAVTSLNFAR